VQIIKNGGWYFSWMSGVNKIIQKIESYAHQEYNKPEFKDPKKIKDKIESGVDVLNPEVYCEAQIIDHQFPKYLIENQDHFKQWLIPIKQIKYNVS